MHGIQATLASSIGFAAGALVNVQLVQSPGRDEQLYADAGDNVYLSLTGLLRDPTVTNFTVHIDSIVAGGDASVLLQSSLEQTAVSGDLGGVQVTVPPKGQSGTFYREFTLLQSRYEPEHPAGRWRFWDGRNNDRQHLRLPAARQHADAHDNAGHHGGRRHQRHRS